MLKARLLFLALILGFAFWRLTIFDASSPPTFNSDIKPIIEKSCVHCHNPDGPAFYFPLHTFEDILKRRKVASRWIKNNLMPPWYAVKDTIRYKNDISLTQKEKQAFFDWAKSPLVDKTSSKPLPIDVFPDSINHSKNLLNPEKHIYQIAEPKFIKPGERIYHCFYFENKNFGRQSYINSVFTTYSDGKEVHHIATYLIDRNKVNQNLFIKSPKGFACDGDRGEFSTYEEGLRLVTFDNLYLEQAYGIDVPADKDFILQVHYDSTFLNEVHKSEIALNLKTIDKTQFPVSTVFFNTDYEKINIPANSSGNIVEAEFSLRDEIEQQTSEAFKKDLDHGIQILGSDMHMHFLGKGGRIDLLNSKGPKPILQLNGWNPYTTQSYWLYKPILSSADVTIKTQCYYDNSSENPFRPLKQGEPFLVKGGFYKDNEMCTAQLYIAPCSSNNKCH